MTARANIGLVFLFVSVLIGTAATAQDAGVSIRFQNGTTVTARSWHFTYICATPMRDNPGLTVERTRQSRDLRLLIDGAERVIPEGQLVSMQFEWKTGAPGYLVRGSARLFLTNGERVEVWKWHPEDCGGAELVLPPEGSRQEWLRIDFWRTVAGKTANMLVSPNDVVAICFRGTGTW